MKHKWGCKAFFLNQKAIKYTLDRQKYHKTVSTTFDDKTKIKNIVEKKYSLVNQVLNESNFVNDGTIDAVIAMQLQTYYANGVWGIKPVLDLEVPEVKTI